MGISRIKSVRRVAGLATLTALVLAFQNCGQPGQLAPLSPDNGLLSDPNSDAGNISNGVVTFKDYSKDVNVLALGSKIDVLVVVDNSGSMRSEQANMAMRFGTLIQQLNTLDWRVGITTTDVNFDDPAEINRDRDLIDGRTDGQLLAMANNKYWVSSQDPLTMAQDLFAATVQRSEQGSGREQGVKATYKAIERSFIAASANNQFLRPDAALSVIVVSDADETPHYNFVTNRNRPEKLLELVSTRLVGKAFSFHSIIVRKDDKVCLDLPNSGNEDYGLSYQMLTERTGGVLGSVCDMDYGSQLRLIGAASAQLVKNVSLDCAPVDSDKNGMLDLKVTAVTAGLVIPPYTVNANQLQFAQDLPVGSYKVEYRCQVVSQPAPIAPVAQ